MKIGIIETGLPPQSLGGAEMQAWNLARRLQKKGHEVTVFCRRPTHTPKYEQKENVRIFRTHSMRRPFGILSYLLGIFFCIVKERKNCDVLLCFRAWPNGVIGIFSQKILGIVSCFSIRGGDWYFVEPFWWGKIIYRLLFSSKLPVLVQTAKIRSEVMDKYPEVRPLIIPNGIDFDHSYSLNGKAVMFVGNLIPRKGVAVLIEAFKGISGSKLIIVGDGPERSKLEKLACGLNVDFVGRLEPGEVRQYMAAYANVIILPAVAGEGMPNVLLEAMSIGVPVVASDVAGIRDLFENGQAGVLVPPGEVDALRNAINEVLTDHNFWKQLSLAGRQTACKYSWDKVVIRWEQLFADMVTDQTSNKKNKKRIVE
jgi:glycosyltransferase involved in cell wall biosynthesis